MQKIIAHNGLVIDFRNITRTEGVWSGKVTLVFQDRVDPASTKITANFTGDDLVDFEGEPEANDPIYEFCEMHAATWAGEIADKLAGRPGHLIATQGDVSRAA
jgi:hypothetical protein